MADIGLVQQVAIDTDQLTARCYGCAKCSAGCPVSFATDLKTHQVIRLVNLGQLDKLLSSKAIWLCAFCKTCKQRCPNDIDASEVMDWLKHKALEIGVTPALPNIPVLYEIFMNSVEKLGRVYEAGWIGVYKIKTKTFTNDLKLGLKMIAKGKIKLLPGRINNHRQIKEIFERARKGVR